MTTPFRRVLVAVALLPLGLPVFGFPAARAAVPPQDRGPVQRVLSGKVQDKSGAGVKGAIVYVKDAHTNAIRSAVSTDDGSYRFVQLTQNTDYEIWAKMGDKKSKTKSISSFNTQNDLSFNLVVE